MIKNNLNFINCFKVYKYKSILPPNLTHLTFGHYFNQKVDKLPKNLTHLINGILKNAELITDAELSFEGHPTNTTYEHLKKALCKRFRNTIDVPY